MQTPEKMRAGVVSDITNGALPVLKDPSITFKPNHPKNELYKPPFTTISS